MSSALDLRGLFVPLITPFDESGGVALDVVERLCHEFLDDGVAGIVALGTTGESPALDTLERTSIIERCARVCEERGAPLIVGTGTSNTRSTVAQTESLADVPAAVAALVVVPYYVRPSEAGVVAHFRTVAATAPVPLVVYNIPFRTGRNLGPVGLLELAAEPNIAGVKQATTGLDLETLEVLSAAPDDFHVLGGEDPFLYPILLMGGSGGITASAHVCTRQYVSMVECGLAGKADEGRALAETLLPVARALFAEPNPAVIKAVLHAQGRIPTPDVRAPMTNASAGALAAALQAVDAASA